MLSWKLDLSYQLNQKQIRGKSYSEEQLKNFTVSNPSNASLIDKASDNLAQANLREQIYRCKVTEDHEEEEQE
jgi:hypothetical protein